MALAAAALAVSALPAVPRLGAGYGLGVSAAAGAVALVLMARASRRPLSSALLAVVVGFLLRAGLLAVALVLCHRAGGSMLACAAAFLAFFGFGQVLEIALVSGKLAATAQERQA